MKGYTKDDDWQACTDTRLDQTIHHFCHHYQPCGARGAQKVLALYKHSQWPRRHKLGSHSQYAYHHRKSRWLRTKLLAHTDRSATHGHPHSSSTMSAHVPNQSRRHLSPVDSSSTTAPYTSVKSEDCSVAQYQCCCPSGLIKMSGTLKVSFNCARRSAR